MSYTASKIQIIQYLRKLSRNFNMEQMSGFTTINISKALNISRSLTSQYLNDLVKENEVIKISSRPVYYIDKNEIEKKYQIEMKMSEYLSLAELREELNQNSPNLKDFQKAIGSDGSLNYCISQMKSALLYPQGGLPIILYGEKGSGKSYLVKLIHEFCMNQIPTQKQSSLVKKRIFKGEDAQKQMEEIFGKYDEKEKVMQKGLIDEAEGGILCIQDASNLTEKCQQKLSEYISSSKFTRFGDDKVFVEGNTRIILSTTKNPYDSLSQSLVLNIPIICNIPSLRDRNDDERLEFIIKFFKEEQNRLDRSIYISEKLIQFLMEYHFENNINELNKCVKSICANAFSECTSSTFVNVYLYHLPINMMNQITVDRVSKDEDNIIRIDSIEKESKNNRILIMWDQMLNAYNEYVLEMQPFSKFLEHGHKALRYYYDILIFKETYYDARLKAMEKIVLEVLNAVKSAKSINLPLNCAYVLTRMIISYQKNNSVLKQWEQDNRKEIRECLTRMCENMPNEYILTDMIVKQIQSNINIRLNEMNIIFLMININFYNKDLRSQDTIGIILSHGYSTASSIADAANSLLSSYIFEAIDMPLNTSVEKISDKLNKFIEENTHLKNIILLVDMGSLEGIGEVIADSVNVGVINNISTSLALNIGIKIQQHCELEEILKIACEENQCRYKVLSVAAKEKAIVFTNDAGLMVSEKLCRLFKDSLPRKIDLKMIEYDYDELVKNKTEDILFKKYDVVLMIKPYSLKLKKVKSVTLEEIINFKDIDKVNNALRPYLSTEEIECFDQELLKNFSMQSVMENLTILNAPKLLDYVSDSIYSLQHTIGKKFQSKTIVGIYIHICFLVERLVTKTALYKYEGLEDFIQTHQDFIDKVNNSFEAMLSHYNVEMPISEIAYLYEYIENDELKGGGEDEF